MLFFELKLDTKEGTANERTHLHIFSKFIKKNHGKKHWNCRWVKQQKKISKKLLFNDMYENSISTGNLCVQTKIIIRTQELYPFPSSTRVTVSLIPEKLLSFWFWNFQIFSLVFINVYRKVKRNCMSGLFCIANLLEVDRKKHFSTKMK